MKYLFLGIACIVLLLLFMLLYSTTRKKPKRFAGTTIYISPEVPSYGNLQNAYLQLPGGQRIELTDSANVPLLKYETGISYEPRTNHLVFAPKKTPGIDSIRYYFLRTFGMHTYVASFPDGTTVWLSSDSRLYIPTTGRKDGPNMLLAGEAYFKLSEKYTAFSSAKPFILGLMDRDSCKRSLELRGKSFTVSAYPKDDSSSVEAIKGFATIKYTDGKKEKRLVKEGYRGWWQACNSALHLSHLEKDPEPAWKQDLLKFQEVSIRQVMKAVCRNYNVEVKYGTFKEQKMTITISRTQSLDNALKLLYYNTGIPFIFDQGVIWVGS